MVSTKHFLRKKLVKLFLSEKNYHRVKYLKILNDFKRGKPYDPIIEELPNLIPSKGNILDIGANMGQYMCRLSKIFPESMIYSFDPIPANIHALEKMKKDLRLTNVEIRSEAISDKKGRDIIVTPYVKGVPVTTQSGLQSSVKYKEDSNLVSIEVNTITVDGFVTERNIDNITLIKVDTEGAEDRVLVGAARTIMNFKPILILETGMDNVEVQRLIKKGYEAFNFIDGKLIKIKETVKGDLILIHKE